jgi:hypothetical protein
MDALKTNADNYLQAEAHKFEEMKVQHAKKFVAAQIEATQTPMDDSSHDPKNTKPSCFVTSVPQCLTRDELVRQTPDSGTRRKTNIIMGGSAAAADTLTDDIMFGLEIPDNVSTAKTNKAVTAEVLSGVLGYSRLPLRLKTRINPKTKQRESEAIIYSYRHTTNLVVKLYSILQSGIAICGINCKVFFAARASAMPRVLIAKVHEGGKNVQESWSILKAEIDDLPGALTLHTFHNNLTLYRQTSTWALWSWTRHARRKTKFASMSTKRSRFGSWLRTSAPPSARPSKLSRAQSIRYSPEPIFKSHLVTYKAQLEIDDGGVIMDRSAEAGFKLKVHISGANDAKVFEIIDPTDKVRTKTFPLFPVTNPLLPGKDNCAVQISGRHFDAIVHHEFCQPRRPKQYFELQRPLTWTSHDQHRNSGLSEKTRKLQRQATRKQSFQSKNER